MLVSRILQASGGSLLVHDLCINRTAVRSQEKAEWIRLFQNNRNLHSHDHEDLSCTPKTHVKKQGVAACTCGPTARKTDRFLKLTAWPNQWGAKSRGTCINKEVDSAWGTALSLVSDIQSTRMYNIKTRFWVLSLAIFSSHCPTELWVGQKWPMCAPLDLAATCDNRVSDMGPKR